MYEALVDDYGRWLKLLTNERTTQIAASERSVGVIYQPWIDPIVSAVEVRIEPRENPYDTGAALVVLAYSEQEELALEDRRRVKYRLGSLFGAALRHWVDEPHW